MLNKEERIPDSLLPASTLQQLRSRQRVIEVDSQIVNALQKGNSVERLLTHPAGLMGKGSVQKINSDSKLEGDWIRRRYEYLKKKTEDGTIDSMMDSDIVAAKSSGEKPPARAWKDQIQREHKAWCKGNGVIRDIPTEELVARHEERIQYVLESINTERTELGLNQLSLVEV